MKLIHDSSLHLSVAQISTQIAVISLMIRLFISGVGPNSINREFIDYRQLFNNLKYSDRQPKLYTTNHGPLMT